MTQPHDIPLSVALRAVETLLHGQAGKMHARSTGRTRRGFSPTRSAGQGAAAQQLEVEAGQIFALIEPAKGSGKSVDAAVLGYLMAWLTGDADSRTELEAELAELGRPGCLAGVKDRVAVIRAALGVGV